jgi:hypothetical protein
VRKFPDVFVKSSDPPCAPPPKDCVLLNRKFSPPGTDVRTTSTWLRGVVISEVEALEAENVFVPNTNDILNGPREFSANVPGPGSVASVTVPVPTNGGRAGGGANMPLSSNSNVNVTAPAELTNARLSIAPITHRADKSLIATSHWVTSAIGTNRCFVLMDWFLHLTFQK